MFLIQYQNGKFADAERIDYINVNCGEVIFTLTGDEDSMYTVDSDRADIFLNNLGALNDNIDCVTKVYKEQKIINLDR